jgi:hypothetical protein
MTGLSKIQLTPGTTTVLLIRDPESIVPSTLRILTLLSSYFLPRTRSQRARSCDMARRESDKGYFDILAVTRARIASELTMGGDRNDYRQASTL